MPALLKDSSCLATSSSVIWGFFWFSISHLKEHLCDWMSLWSLQRLTLMFVLGLSPKTKFAFAAFDRARHFTQQTPSSSLSSQGYLFIQSKLKARGGFPLLPFFFSKTESVYEVCGTFSFCNDCRWSEECLDTPITTFGSKGRHRVQPACELDLPNLGASTPSQQTIHRNPPHPTGFWINFADWQGQPGTPFINVWPTATYKLA